MLLRCLTALAGVTALLLPAEYPIELDGAGGVTDRVRALDGREEEVRSAVADVAGEGLRLYVAYVRDFAGLTAQTWTDATAERNQLPAEAVLLAVGTAEGAFAFSVDASSGLIPEQIDEIRRTAVGPAVERHDWAGAAIGAAIGAARGLAAVREGAPVPSLAPSTGPANPGAAPGSGGIPVVLPIAVFAAGVLVLCYLVARGARGGGRGRRRK